MAETSQILPVEAWFHPDDATGDLVIHGPFPAHAERVWGVEVVTSVPMKTDEPPVQIAAHPRQREGLEFLNYLGDSRADVFVNVVFSDARVAADLDAEGSVDSFGQIVQASLLTVYGVAGSIARRGGGLWTPAGHPNAPTEYVDRVHNAAAASRRPLASCDPRLDISGQPDGPGERTVQAVGDAVRLLASDPSDKEGVAQLFADMVYCGTLGWLTLSEIGQALHTQWEQDGYRLSGMVTVVLPGEFIETVRRLNILGIPDNNIQVYFARDEVDSAENEAYRAVMELGRIPASLLS